MAKTFNVSTAVSFVVAGAGLPVAKQINRAVLSGTGSADVLTKLGVNIAVDTSVAQTCLNGAGLCFMFAPKFHPTLIRAADVRSGLGTRSCLNLLGVLSNPARTPRQLIGVWHPSLFEPMAQALAILKTDRAWIVHGKDGLDELSLSDETYVAEVFGNKIKEFRIAPEDFGLQRAKTDHLKAKTPAQSAEIIREVLTSKRRDEARSLVVLNAAAALVIGGVAKDTMQAARLAEQSIDSGMAQNKLDRLIQVTNKKQTSAGS
jgi:anthranilate phosphoribosyltransferase